MHNALDKYLQTLAHELRALPQAQRDSEVREMRQHLEAIIARLCEGGLSEAEATEAALAQFGVARTVGRELKRASDSKNLWRRALLAPLCGVASFAPLSLGACLLDARATDGMESLGVKGWPYLVPGFVMLGLISMASGAVASRVSPRWGGRSMLCLPFVACLAAVLAGMFPQEVLSDAGVFLGAFAVPLAFYCSGTFLGSRWGNGSLQLRGTRPDEPTKVT